MTIPMPRRIATGASDEQLGAPFVLLLIWLFFEFGRPPRPFGIPLAISLISFVVWVARRDKQWSRQSQWWFVLLGVMVLGIPFAENTYAAFWATRDVAVRFLCICLPLQALTTSVRRLRVWAYTFIAVALYVGAWAATHGGYGPSGAGGGQDENYVAALMGMAVPFAYFSIFAEKRLVPRILFGVAIVIFLAAIALGQDPSRGGFLGLCAVGVYCLNRSPRKGLGIAVFAVAVAALLVIAGPSFWAAIGTSTDYQDGTGDMRIEVWKAGLRMWEGNPLFGVGPGNFRWVIEQYQSAEQFAKFGRGLGGSIIAHSLWVEMLAELGIAGVIASGIIFWRTWSGVGRVRDEIRAIGSSASPELVQLACYADAIRAGMLAILVNGVFLSLYYYSHIWLLLALGSAVPFIYRRMRGPEPGAGQAALPQLLGSRHRTPPPAVPAVVGAVQRTSDRRRK
jgi:O-antigen ligase